MNFVHELTDQKLNGSADAKYQKYFLQCNDDVFLSTSPISMERIFFEVFFHLL